MRQTVSVGQFVRDGVALVHEDTGRGDPPLVFVHGLACHRGFWSEQVKHFAPRHRVLAPDLRGHGDSDAPEQRYTIDPAHVTGSVWEESLRSWDDAEALSRCRVPLLYLDAGTPNADLSRAASLAPQLVVWRTVGSGHFSPLEVPEQVNSMLEWFVEITTSAARRSPSQTLRTNRPMTSS